MSAGEADIAVIEPAGAVNARAAVALEREVLQHFEKGKRSFVVDFAKVDLFTSAGIRVLVMLRQRLPAVGGQLVLAAMSPHVRMVFDVAGLTSQFAIVDTRAEAVVRAGVLPAPPRAVPEEEAAPTPDPAPVQSQSQAGGLRAALEAAGVRMPPAAPGRPGGPSPLTTALREALTGRRGTE
jgi:anti-anti-sigma factor